MSVTLTVVENDLKKLHSPENVEKLEMCVEAFEIFTGVSIAVNGSNQLEHRVVVNENRMSVSLLYSVPVINDVAKSGKFPPGSELAKLNSSVQKLRKALQSEGIRIETKITSIETLNLPR